MALPEPVLDDLRFQKDLVDEARRRIIHYCPEWTDYNLSDPGITLIEMFAWMTEMIVYRLNKVPEKNYIKFLELLGMQLHPASSARTELTFWLSTPFPISLGDETTAIVPKGTEVATRRTEEEAEVIFTTDERLEIIPPNLVYLYPENDFQKNHAAQLGKRSFVPFQNPPQIGDAFYLGFDSEQDLSGHILQLMFVCEQTEGVGIKRNDPPLVWECSMGNGEWYEVSPSTRPDEQDTTGGLNNPAGKLVLYLPLAMKPDQVYGRSAYWVRCRLEQRRPKEQGMYSESPQIRNLTAYALGAATRATHAVIIQDEILGRSSGDPGQTFQLEYNPVLGLQSGEVVLVEEKQDGELVPVPWRSVRDFSKSDRFDRHFTLETTTGEIRFGPSIRQRDGSVQQFGRVPPANSTIRFSNYRYGGGVVGNVPIGKLQVLKSSIPYIDRVTNLTRATGGQDSESLDEAKVRAQHELRAQRRAVTAEDYEDLTQNTIEGIARVKCNIPQNSNGRLPPGMIEILIVPQVADSLQGRDRDLSKLHVDEALLKQVETHLDKYRLLTTTLQIREPSYIGVQIEADIVVSDYSQPDIVRNQVIERLDQFLCCLDITPNHQTKDELLGDDWEGWPFGRNLFEAEVFSLIQRVPGVKHVLNVTLRQRAVNPAHERPDSEEDTDIADDDQQTRPRAIRKKVLRVPADTLLCPLIHKINITDLDDDDDED